jgi:hypothetical protein
VTGVSASTDIVANTTIAKSKTQKHLEITLQKTKEELRGLAKQFSKKQEKEEAKANNRKASLYEGVIAGGAPTGEVSNFRLYSLIVRISLSFFAFVIRFLLFGLNSNFHSRLTFR